LASFTMNDRKKTPSPDNIISTKNLEYLDLLESGSFIFI
jgi:hypothetical protein